MRKIDALIAENDRLRQRVAELENLQQVSEIGQHFVADLELLCITDNQGRFLQANSRWEETLGYALSELIGKELINFIYPDDVVRTQMALQYSAENPVLDFVNRYRKKDGSYCWLQWRSFPKDDLIFASARDISATKEIEFQLKESEERYRLLFENMTTGFALHEVICDEQGKPSDYLYLEVNPAFEKLTGVPASALLGKTVRQVMPETEQYWIEVFGTVALTGEPISYENYSQELGKYYNTWVFCPRKGQFAVVFSDITESKKAAQELAESRSLLLAAIEQSPSAIVIADAPDARIRLANTAALEMRGASSAELIGIPMELHPLRWQTCHWDGTLFDPLELPLSKAILHGKIGHNEKVMIRDTKNRHHFILVNSAPVYNDKQEITAAVAVFNDITESKKAEDALKELASTFTHLSGAELFESITRHIATSLKVNYAYVGKLTPDGSSIHILGGYSQGNSMIPFDYPLAGAPCQHVIAGNTCEYASGIQELFPSDQLLREMGVECYLGMPIFDKNKQPIGLMVVMDSQPMENFEREKVLFDIFSDRVEVEIGRMEAAEKLNQHQEHLEELVEMRTAELANVNKELESFAYSVSHDLRAPLRHIDGFSRILSEEYRDRLDASGASLLQKLRSSTNHMGQLIEGLLQLSRMSREGLKKESVDLSMLAQEIAQELRETNPERHSTWEIEPGCLVNGDPHMLRALMQNLLHNAWKFSSNGEHAKVTFGRLPAEQVPRERNITHPVFFVRDNGVGFNMTYADKLFGTFQRLHSENEFPGTGIGLATVQRIINRHGGQIWAESKPGRGATFYFTIP